MKNKKAILIIQIVAILLILSIGPICLIGFFSAESLRHYMFSDIQDFEKLDQYAVTELSPSDDKYLNGLSFESSYTKEISYENASFTIYAYVFADTETAVLYFKNSTGKSTDSEHNYSMSTNYLFNSFYILQYDCCVYRVEGGNYNDFAEAVNYINENFPINTEETK